MTVQEFKTSANSKLKKFSPSASLDVEVLLEFALNFSKTQLLLNRNSEIPQKKLEWLESAIEKRITGLPVAYITNHKEFFGFDFFVTPAVLIPKPDTEILVERAIELFFEKMDSRPNSILTICDMCTGSGCIGIAVLKALKEEYNVPQEKLPKITLVDISPEALEIARTNGERLIPEGNLRFVRSNLFEIVPYSFDLILTNPPYIPHTLVEELLKDGRNEPRLALDGDVTTFGDRAYSIEGDELDDGLEIIRNLIPQAKQHLSPFGTILMETGEYNAEAAAKLGESQGFRYKIHKDLEGQLRVVEMEAQRKISS